MRPFAVTAAYRSSHRRKCLSRIGEISPRHSERRWLLNNARRFLSLLQSLLRISSGYSFEPGRMMRPCPSFSDSAARHRLNCSRLTKGTEIDVEEYPKKHDQGREVMYDIRERNQDPPELMWEPHHHAGDHIRDGTGDNLPEHQLLPAVEEAGLG